MGGKIKKMGGYVRETGTGVAQLEKRVDMLERGVA
jgi:hypothetical protein